MNQLTTLTVHLVVFFIILLVFVGVLIFCVLIIVFVLCWACNQIKWLKKIWMTKNDESSQEINWKISVLAIIYRKHTTQTRSQGGIWVIPLPLTENLLGFLRKNPKNTPPHFSYTKISKYPLEKFLVTPLILHIIFFFHYRTLNPSISRNKSHKKYCWIINFLNFKGSH